MRAICFLLAVTCSLSWAAAQTASFSFICRIKKAGTCQTACASPSSCLAECKDCDKAKCRAADCWEYDFPGQDDLQHYFKKLPPELRDRFLKSLKIEGKKID